MCKAAFEAEGGAPCSAADHRVRLNVAARHALCMGRSGSTSSVAQSTGELAPGWSDRNSSCVCHRTLENLVSARSARSNCRKASR
jgi:hypothetical protein